MTPKTASDEMLKIVTADDVKSDDKAETDLKPLKPVVKDTPKTETVKIGSITKPSNVVSIAPRLEVDGRIIPDADVPTEFRQGVLDLMVEGHGFLRPDFVQSKDDIYISGSQIRRFKLRKGDMVGGQVRRPKENERYFGLLKVEKVNDAPVEETAERPFFDKLSPIYPQPQIVMETEAEVLSTRMIDMICPIGFGQRGLIVSPPKAGKTWLLKDIATAVAKNYPKIHLMAVLIAERPEEVTDLSRSVKGEVVASNFDESPIQQIKVAEVALARAKRLVEEGKDVFIILDSVTRLARAYNLAVPGSGRSLSGGFDPSALYPAKQFLGAARNIEDGGSLTVIGTTLIDTGSRMDELIYEEFKGTGNMELHLTRKLAERRIFPAIDIQKSGTRKEELLFGNKNTELMARMRRMIDLLDEDERTEVFIRQLKSTKNNKEFLKKIVENGK